MATSYSGNHPKQKYRIEIRCFRKKTMELEVLPETRPYAIQVEDVTCADTCHFNWAHGPGYVKGMVVGSLRALGRWMLQACGCRRTVVIPSDAECQEMMRRPPWSQLVQADGQ